MPDLRTGAPEPMRTLCRVSFNVQRWPKAAGLLSGGRRGKQTSLIARAILCGSVSPGVEPKKTRPASPRTGLLPSRLETPERRVNVR